MADVLIDWRDDLAQMAACDEAVIFAAGYESFQAAWDACPRGDWMLWWIGKTSARQQGPERRRLVRVACQCARLALPFVTAGECRPLQAIETAERWANGDETVTLAAVRSAGDAAYAAYAAVNAAAAAAAAYVAAYVAAAAYKAADASAAAAAAAYVAAYVAAAAYKAADASAAAVNAAYAAAYAADDAAADAHSATLARCADLVRAEYPTPPAVTR